MTPDSVRHQQSFIEKMNRFYGNMENALYAAEVLCGEYSVDGTCTMKSDCPFYKEYGLHHKDGCKAKVVRFLLGDHIEQHDTENPK